MAGRKSRGSPPLATGEGRNPTSESGERIRGQTERLSLAALDYGSRLGSLTAPALANRLYRYHFTPGGSRWWGTVDSPDAARRFLRVPAGSFRLAGDWSSPVALTDSWFHWAGRDPNRTSDYKVYLSPALAELPGALATLLGAAATLPVTGIKAGAEAATLLRPDRVVIYCSQAAEVCVIATALGRALGGIAAHGVPFTAALTPDGLLSWGSDREARRILGRRHRRPASAKIEASDGSKGAGRSWRTMVAAVAALGLVAGRSRPSSVAVALRYLARTGVDPRTFGPAATQLP